MRSMPCRTAALTLLLLAPAAFAQTPRPLPSLAAATLVYDTKAKAETTWPAALDALATFDVVFLGETHIDDTTHRVELHVLEHLLARKQGKVVLAMEMFERDVQKVLDDYLQGRIDETAFLQQARPWGNYHTAYRPLVEAAKAAKIPVVAANFPGSLRRQLARGGKQAIEALPAEARALMPAEIFPGSAAYWERVDRAVRGHMGGPSGGTPEERLYEAQNMWDNSMGDNVAKARAAHPDSLVLHVAGGFHVAYRDGTVAQFVRRSPGCRFAVASIVPTLRQHDARPERDVAMADFLIYAEAHARDENDGNYAVALPAELRYRLHVDERGKDQPLLIWLPDRGTRTEDAFAFWQLAIGAQAAVAVVEAPFPELQGDLALGGRYAFGDGFRADYSRVQQGLARIVEWVTRRYPVDARKVVIAGAGDGGAVALWSALYGDWLAADYVAIDPNDLTRLGMEALPDQAPAARSLQLVAQRIDRNRLEAVAADYTKVGLATTVAPADAAAHGLAELVRSPLGLPAAATGTAAQLLLVLPQDLPRAREWADLYAANLARTGKQSRVVLASLLPAIPADEAAQRVRRLGIGGDGFWPVSTFANGQGLPLAGGPFGGTTIVVLPKGTSDADRAAWLEHEKNRVIKKRSMFANIAIAEAADAPSLADVVAQLKARGRSRFLIVPAVFCADAATMGSLQEQLGTAAEGLDLAWLPGLGAELAAMVH
jgi:uncharacterized iron-regulated protein